MIVKGRQWQLGHKVHAISDPDGVRNDVVVRGNELWVSCLRAGVSVNCRVVEGRWSVRSHIQSEKRRERAS